jgi:hypothetical protein
VIAAAVVLDPTSVTVTTARQLLARHTPAGTGMTCDRCGLPWPCPTAAHAGEVCQAGGLTPPPLSLRGAVIRRSAPSTVDEATRQLRVLRDLPTRTPAQALVTGPRGDPTGRSR